MSETIEIKTEPTKKYPEPEFVFNNQEAKVAKAGHLGNRKCLTFSNGVWWSNTEYSMDRERATARTLSAAWDAGDDNTIYYVLPEEPWDFSPPKRIAKMFPRHVLELIKAAPSNEMVKGWMLKITKHLPPADADTYEKLAAWVEALPVPEPSPKPDSKNKKDIDIVISFSRQTTGTARFSCTEVGTDDYCLDDDEIQRIIDDNEEADMSELVEELCSYINDTVWDQCQNISWDDDLEGKNYDHHDYGDSDEESYDYRSAAVKEKLVEWLRARMPEKARQLGL